VNQTNLIICQVKTPGGIKEIVTPLTKDEVFSRGIGPDAIVGEFKPPLTASEPMSSDQFLVNPSFVAFMHDLIARYAPEEKRFKSEAKKLIEGWIYIIDQRTPNPEGEVPSEDIIGAFQVDNGALIPGSYKPNPKHRILSDSRGFFCLDKELHQRLLDELRMRPIEK
jgi:hypothetical protein